MIILNAREERQSSDAIEMQAVVVGVSADKNHRSKALNLPW